MTDHIVWGQRRWSLLCSGAYLTVYHHLEVQFSDRLSLQGSLAKNDPAGAQQAQLPPCVFTWADLSLWEKEAQLLGGPCPWILYLSWPNDGKGSEEFGKSQNSGDRQIWGVSAWMFHMDVTLGDRWLKSSEPKFPSLSKGGEEDLLTNVFWRTEVETPIIVQA